jgi:nitrate reductase NapAB chaperone NapD
MSIKYFVKIEHYVERHFIKSFSKKYGRAWVITIETLIREFQSFDILLEKTIAEKIVELDNIKICKVEFKIAGSNESRHGSGNRCIVAVDKNSNVVNVLLVYHKNDLGDGNETIKWKNIIKENYLEYKNLF